MRGGGIAASGDVDFIAAREEEFRIHTVRVFYITHPDGPAQTVSVRTGGGVAHDFIIAVNRFAAPEHWLRVLQNKTHELSFQAALFLLEERFASQKCNRFFPGNRKTEARFQRSV